MRTAVFLCQCLCAGVGWATPIAITQCSRYVTNANDVVRINGVDHGVISVRTDLPITRPAKITMKMRRTACSARNPGHFGVELYGGDGFRAHFYTHDGANFIASLHQRKTKLYDNGVRGSSVVFPPQADSPWVDVAIYVQPKLAEMHAAGVPRGMLSDALLPITGLGLYGYHNDIEVRDLAWEPLPEAEAASADPRPSFDASFDQGLDGLTAQGGLQPSRAVNVERVPGVSGQAVRVAARDKTPAGQPQLEYAAKGLFADHGTLMFWIKTDWDGRYTGDIPIYPMIEGLDDAGRRKLAVAMTWWVSFSLGRAGNLRGEEMKRESRPTWCRGDWNHIAMVWSEGDWCKAYLNGLPYQQPFGFNGKVFANLDVKAVSRLTVGTGRQAAEAAFDELKIYKRPLSNGEIYDAYRAFMPVDLILDRTVIAPDRDEEVVVVAVPGGAYMRPMPAERPPSTGRIDIRIQIVDAADRVVAEKEFLKNVNAPTELRVPVHNLPAGDYRVRCVVGRAPRSLLGWAGLFGRPAQTAGTVQRSFGLKAYRPQPAMPPVDDDIRLGGVLFEKDIRDSKVLESGGANLVASPCGDYLEGGPRKMSRFAFEVRFPERCQTGRPVMLEIEWPDDKPRSMGLYMYPQSKNAQHRDRLGGGVQSGIEYPLTGKMQRTRYLFYPGLTNYLFEARAMVDGFPAALSAFRVYEIQNDRLPKLAVRRPDGLPPRRFGYQDEDETFDQNLGWDYKDRNAQSVTERLLDYLDYTGQNAWQYPFLRYNGYNFPMEGATHTLYPYSADAFRYMTEALDRRGVATIAGINLYTLPELYVLPDQIDEAVRKGWVLTRFTDPPLRPGGQPRPNHASPEVRAMIARHVCETAQRYGTLPGVEGISVSTHHVGFYTSPDEGYDDYTVGRFSRETGVAVPAENAAERKAFLACQPQAETWLNWRARQSVALFRDIRAGMDKVSPRLNLYVVSEIPDGPSPENPALLKQLQSIRGIYLVQGRNNTRSRHRQHWGSPATNCNECAYDPAVAARFMNGRLGFVDNAPTYFESFNGSLKNDVYAGYFQNADVKPFGRYFLKDLAFAVAAMDVQRYLIGAQPLGTWGRDVETREFAKAFGALPALPFETSHGACDPVTVRYLNTDKGTYVYAVSMLWDDCEAALAYSSAQPLQDLSTGERISDGKVALRAFALRSFWSPDPQVRVTGVEVAVPSRVPDYCKAQIDQAQRAIDASAAEKVPCDDARETLAQVRERLREGRYAELHRLLFSLPIREAVNRAAAAASGKSGG